MGGPRTRRFHRYCKISEAKKIWKEIKKEIRFFWDVTLCSLVDHDILKECTASIFWVGRYEVLSAVTMKRETEISRGEFPFLNPCNMETMVENTSSEIYVHTYQDILLLFIHFLAPTGAWGSHKTSHFTSVS
jgi:hypothetical protein